MAKLKARKRRRIRLRRVAVVLLVFVALLVAAGGILILHARALVLAALRVEFPRCDVSIGRATLNPLRTLTLYDVEIIDRARPNVESSVTVERVVANFALRAGLKFDIDLDVVRPRVALSEVTGKTPPFADLFERKPSEKPSRFRLRQGRMRDCQVKIDDPSFKLETAFEVRATSLDQPNAQISIRNWQVKFDSPTLRLDTSIDVAATGLDLTGSDNAASGATPADLAVVLSDLTLTTESTAVAQNADGTVSASEEKGKTTFRIARLEASLGYDAAKARTLDRFLLHEVRASDCTVAVRYPDIQEPNFSLSTTFALGLANASGDVYNYPTRLEINSGDFLLNAGLLKTHPLRVAIDANLDARRDGPSVRMAGTLTAITATEVPELGVQAKLNGEITALLDKTGLHVTTLFEQQPAEQQPAEHLAHLFENKERHRIPVIHDFTDLTGNVERFELALAYTPELGFGLTGDIKAEGLEGTSDPMMLTVKGIAVDTTFSLLPPERGAALELVVGDPNSVAGPGRLVADKVTWNAPGDMHFPAAGATAHLWSEDYVWTLGDILGAIFEGHGTGTIQALADGTVTLDLQFDSVNMAPLFAEITGKEEDQMTGRADATLAIVLKDAGAGLGLYSIKGTLRTRAPGGVLMLKEKEQSFGSVPGGDKVLGAVKQQMSPRFYDHFLEKFKNYHYESITIDASTEGNDYVLVVKIRDADKKNPLPVDLTIRYSRVYIYHDTPPPPDEGTRQ
ncbi:MAG: hypothetical protein JW889_08915 [Verrucomicrobia bacterium]|nr:hypothetical protein [Verrucomicrobiota bacterium]